MDITVVIATHNQVYRLKLVLAGLQHQTFPVDRFEIIVVDDGCTDGTSTMLKQVEIPNLRVTHLYPNQGRCRARNVGITQATGELIVFLDGDALPHPGLLEAYWTVYQATDKAGVFCGHLFSLSDLEYLEDPQTGMLSDRPLASVMKDYLVQRLSTIVVTEDLIATDFETIHRRAVPGAYPFPALAAMQEQIIELLEWRSSSVVSWIGFMPHNGAIPRKALQEVGGFDPAIPFCEGWELAYRLQQQGYHPQFVPRACSYHLYHHHDFSNPEKAWQETLIRHQAIEYMRHKHHNPAIGLLLFWFAALWPDPFIPEEAVISDLLTFDDRYRAMTPEQWQAYQWVLDHHPVYRCTKERDAVFQRAS